MMSGTKDEYEPFYDVIYTDKLPDPPHPGSLEIPSSEGFAVKDQL